MTTHVSKSRIRLGIESVVTLAVLVVLFVASEWIAMRFLQIPGYLIMAGFDLLQNTLLPGLTGTAFWALFAAYLTVISMAIGYIVHQMRTRK
ncbi:hypothetical protein [Halocatena pleomorpha]|uniref:Uncharacterized protein n=1 Tax=Halocatena pleomorpha TaxID=1785090 RepID=A0A3P3R5M9_9EURY|nr:hypothetical protein [Halocatena pleomorpha]RRJ28801.1 hypothetical protein EIK79_14865 [Halocatena pleomorpha]